MNSPTRAAALVLLLLMLQTNTTPAEAAVGPSVAGAGTVSLGDRLKRRFEFHAVTREDGSVAGYITFNDPTALPSQDVDGTGEAGAEGPPSGLEMTATIDSLRVEGRRAALSGVVSSTNHPGYVGLRVLLTVEDRSGGEPGAAPDRITWGVYRGAGEWLASDADLPDSPLSLVAEREIDAGRFPLSSYALARIDEGDIRVSE